MAVLQVKWNYQTAGDPDGIPLLFLHGLMGSGSIWLPTINKLPPTIYSVAPDLPGHGKTGADLTQLDFDSLSQALISFIDKNLRRKAVLAGYSMGGRVALYTALRYPDRFTGLILESATAGIEDKPQRRLRLIEDRRIAGKLRQSEMRDFLTDWYRQPIFEHLTSDLAAAIIAQKSNNNPDDLAEVVDRLSQGRQPSLWAKLGQWRKPTLIIAGEHDAKYRKIAIRMASLISSAKSAIIRDAGHIVHLERNKDFVSVLNSFLSSYIL